MNERTDGAKRIEAHKNRNGCGKIQPTARQTHGVVKFHNCYCDHLHSGMEHLLFIYEHYCKGLLPHSGTILDQSNKLIEIIRLIDRLKHERDLKIQEEQARRLKTR